MLEVLQVFATSNPKQQKGQALSFVFVVILMELGVATCFFLGLCIHLNLANIVSSYELFIPLARTKACLFCCCCYK
jgi:hypothetical protein